MTHDSVGDQLCYRDMAWKHARIHFSYLKHRTYFSVRFTATGNPNNFKNEEKEHFKTTTIWWLWYTVQ